MGEMTWKVYKFICEYTRIHGTSPTYTQISDACGIAYSSVAKHLTYLEGRELLYRPGSRRFRITLREANTDLAIASLEKHRAEGE